MARPNGSTSRGRTRRLCTRCLTTYYLLGTTYYLLLYYLLLITYYLLLTTNYLLLSIDQLPLTAHYPLPTTHYSLPTTYYSLLTVVCEVPQFLKTCKPPMKFPAVNKGVEVVKTRTDMLDTVCQLVLDNFKKVPALVISGAHPRDLRCPSS